MRNEDLRSILEGLMKDGLLTPRDVVAYAEPEDSPLHRYFEWDDTEAAKKWREDQARQLIRTVTVEIHRQEPVTVRAFVSLPQDRDLGAGYRATTEVIRVPQLREQLAEEMRRAARDWARRAETFSVDLDISVIETQADRISPKPLKEAA